MNSLMQWDPFRDLDAWSKGLSSLFSPQNGQGTKAWVPPVDILEDEKSYVIKADLPEVNKENIKVSVEAGFLTISGERKFEKEQKNGQKYHRVERTYGSFTRSFQLPDDVDAGKVNAEFKDGLLKVSLLKSEQAQPKLIDVKIH